MSCRPSASLEEADVAVDLGQSPAEVVLAFSDSDLALAAAWREEADLLPTMRLASSSG